MSTPLMKQAAGTGTVGTTSGSSCGAGPVAIEGEEDDEARGRLLYKGASWVAECASHNWKTRGRGRGVRSTRAL
jgi:hypothetical protein